MLRASAYVPVSVPLIFGGAGLPPRARKKARRPAARAESAHGEGVRRLREWQISQWDTRFCNPRKVGGGCTKIISEAVRNGRLRGAPAASRRRRTVSNRVSRHRHAHLTLCSS